MISRREFFKRCGAGAAALFTWTSSGCASEHKKPKAKTVKDNPYEYDIERFKKVDPALILYDEASPIKVTAKRLRGLAVDSNDTVFATGDRRVFAYDANGRPSRSFALNEEAHCLAASNSAEIYVGLKEHVEVFDAGGTRKSTWTSLGEKAFVTSLAVHNGHLVAADSGNKQLWLFTTAGKLLKFINGGFVVPSPYFDVDFDHEGNIWAVNPGRLRLEKYTPGGKKLDTWGKASMELDGFPGCCNPTHFAIGEGGSFVTAEKGIARLKKYDSRGTLQGVVAGPDRFKEGITGLDLALDSKGRVLVIDNTRREIRIFTPRHSRDGNAVKAK